VNRLGKVLLWSLLAFEAINGLAIWAAASAGEGSTVVGFALIGLLPGIPGIFVAREIWRDRSTRHLERETSRTFARTREMLVRYDFPADAIRDHDRMVEGWDRMRAAHNRGGAWMP